MFPCFLEMMLQNYFKTGFSRWCEANSVIEILARVQALVCFASEFLSRAMLLLSPPTQGICLSARHRNSEILETKNQKAHWRACVKAT